MFPNGVDAGTGEVTPPDNELMEIDGVMPLDDEAALPGFSLAQVAPRVPATTTLTAPLLDGRAVPREFRESYRELRFALEQARDRSGVRTVGIVSVDPDDGRSLTAANLALALTEGGARRVALLDACFGEPSLAKLLAADPAVGLAEVLTRRVTAERAMFAAGPEGLFAMAAGNAEASGLDPLDAAESFGALANRLATVFDYVLVDTPALAAHVDAAALASRLDGVILVVRARRTTARSVDAAISRLGESRVLGLVLNRL